MNDPQQVPERLLVPQTANISLVDGAITCSRDLLSYSAYRDVRPPKRLLLTFISLRNKSDAHFLNFARRYGFLGLCRCGRIHTHNPEMCSPCGYEPVECWRSFVDQAHAIAKISDTLDQGGEGSLEDWRLAFCMAADSGEFFARSVCKTNRYLRKIGRFRQKELARSVQGWLDVVRITPKIYWSQDIRQYQVELSPSSPDYRWLTLFGHLAWELVSAVAGVEKLRICAACAHPYIPSRKRPAEGRRNFCLKCGRKAAVRLATQRWRERQQWQKEQKGKKK